MTGPRVPKLVKGKGEGEDVGDRVAAYLRALEVGKAKYAEADALLEVLVKEMRVGVPVSLNGAHGGGGRFVAILVDQYATRTVVWRPVGVRRFRIEVKPR